MATLLSWFWGLTVGLFAPTALATPVLPLPLPQDFSLPTHTVSTLAATSFSTDPFSSPAFSVTAEPGDPQVFVTTNSTCRDTAPIHYQIVLRNEGVGSVSGGTLLVAHPVDSTISASAPQPHDTLAKEGVVGWYQPSLRPTESVTYELAILSSPSAEALASSVHVQFSYFDATQTLQQVYTSLSLPSCGSEGEATSYAPPFWLHLAGHLAHAQEAPAPQFRPNDPAKQPAIVCDPAEQGCVPTYQDLELGPNYERALDPARRPVICSRYDTRGNCVEQLPDLGLNFEEAYADILPGDCRVEEDDIIITPAYHDAFDRRGEPAAPFMQPLYESGEDFRILVHENAILGWQHYTEAYDKLREIHRKHWQRQADAVAQVLAGTATTQQLRARLQPVNTFDRDWRQETQQTLNDLLEAYEDMQEERLSKFDPVAEQAIANARLAIQRSCAEDSDGGLAQLLPTVRQAYEQSLDDRLAAYQQMHATFLDTNSPAVEAEHREVTWRAALLAALDALDQGNPTPLRQYQQNIPTADAAGFRAILAATYTPHRTADEAADRVMRLEHWEVALDTPKTVATNCVKEQKFRDPVETTYCESNGPLPEIIITGRPRPDRLPKLPAAPIQQNPAEFQENLVKGSPCSGRPGDPYWAADCSCHCNQLVPVAEGGVQLCQAQAGAPAVQGDVFQPGLRPITRHDIFVTTREECLQDQSGHEAPFF